MSVIENQVARIFMRKLLDETFVRYTGIGVANMLLCTAVMYLLYNLTGLDSWICALVNHGLGGIISYCCNRRFVFREKERSFRTLVLFVLNLCVCYLIAYGIAIPGMRKLAGHWPDRVWENIAMGIGMLLFIALNYFGQRYVVFRQPKKKP